MEISMVKKRTFFSSALLVLVVLVSTGCATTKAELANNTDKTQVWEVSAPSDKVFRTYKDYSEENLNGGDFLWSGGLRVKGYFYGPDAELSIKMEGNPFARITYLHFEFNGSSDSTMVKVSYYNTPWRKKAEKFKSLLPTKVVSAP